MQCEIDQMFFLLKMLFSSVEVPSVLRGLLLRLDTWPQVRVCVFFPEAGKCGLWALRCESNPPVSCAPQRDALWTCGCVSSSWAGYTVCGQVRASCVCGLQAFCSSAELFPKALWGWRVQSLTDTIPSEAEGTPILREGLGTVRYLWAAEGSWHLGNDGRFECRNDGETCGNLNRSPGGTLEKGPNSYQAGSPRHHCSAQPHHGLL